MASKGGNVPVAARPQGTVALTSVTHTIGSLTSMPTHDGARDASASSTPRQPISRTQSRRGKMSVSNAPSIAGDRDGSTTANPGARVLVASDSPAKSSANSMYGRPATVQLNTPSKREQDDSVNEGGAAHGRRARRRDSADWFNPEKSTNVYRPADTELNVDVQVVNDGIADLDQVRRELAERAQRQKDQLAQHISDPPTGYQATLPRLSELDVTNSWDKLLRMMRNEYDMSCLTNCLARELDEDVAWNPEMLLVQLTSDLLDAAELQQDAGEAYVPVEASDIGRMTGGEVTRKRHEKGAAAPPAATPASKSPAAAPNAAAGAPPAAAGTAKATPPPPFQATDSKAQRKRSVAANGNTASPGAHAGPAVTSPRSNNASRNGSGAPSRNRSTAGSVAGASSAANSSNVSAAAPSANKEARASGSGAPASKLPAPKSFRKK